VSVPGCESQSSLAPHRVLFAFGFASPSGRDSTRAVALSSAFRPKRYFPSYSDSPAALRAALMAEKRVGRAVDAVDGVVHGAVHGVHSAADGGVNGIDGVVHGVGGPRDGIAHTVN